MSPPWVPLRPTWSSRSEKDLRKLSKKDQEKMLDAVKEYADTGRGKITKVKGTKPQEWRLRKGDHVPDSNSLRVESTSSGSAGDLLHTARKSVVFYPRCGNFPQRGPDYSSGDSMVTLAAQGAEKPDGPYTLTYCSNLSYRYPPGRS